MAIHAQFRRRYIVGIQNRHKQHKQAVLRIFHKIRSHPGSYMTGYKPSRAGVPKSIPRQPAGLTKKAAGFWSTMKKGWSWVKSKFDKHKGAIYEAGKKHATAAAKHVGTRLYDAGKKAGKQVVDRAIQVAERNLEHYTEKVENKVKTLADKAEYHISQYDRPPKKGSGWVSDYKRAAVSRATRGRIPGRYGVQHYTGFSPTVMAGSYGVLPTLGRRISHGGRDLVSMVGAKSGRGVFSRRFKRRARAGVQAFRQQR